MRPIGYFAQCQATGNLYNYTWKEDDSFFIKTKDGGWVKANINDYEILEIGIITESYDS